MLGLNMKFQKIIKTGFKDMSIWDPQDFFKVLGHVTCNALTSCKKTKKIDDWFQRYTETDGLRK